MSFRVLVLASFAVLTLILGAACDRTNCGPDCIGVPNGSGAGGTAGAGGQGGTAIGGAGGAGGAAAMTCPLPASTVCAPPAPSFANVITPILDRSCNTCHAEGNPDGLWPLRAYTDVVAWSQLISADLVSCHMPPPDSATPFPESDRQTVFAWVACGSPNN